MARSRLEIERSLAANIAATDPGLATRTGPLRRGYIKPFAAELETVEARAQHVARLSSIILAEAETDEELESLGGSLGLERNEGSASRGFVVFATGVRPGISDVKRVLPGVIIGTSDGGLAYQTKESRSLPGSNADAFFVASRRRFEIRVPVEALAVGEDHDVPPGRINTILSSLDDFSDVANLEEVTGGTSRETNSQFASRIATRLLGIDRGVGGGLLDEAMRFSDQVKSVVAVLSTDHDLFRRRTSRPAIDLYVNGAYVRQVTDTYTAVGGETSFTLPSQPVLDLTAVSVNGVAVDFSLIQDTTRETGGSPIGRDRVALTTALGPGDQLEVSYDANGLLLDMLEAFNQVEDEEGVDGVASRFGTTILPRTPRDVEIEVDISATGLSSFDPAALTTNIQEQTAAYIASGDRVPVLSPKLLRDQLFDTVPGLSRLTINTFRRTDGGPTFGIITIAKNERSTTTDDLVRVRVRS